MRDGLPPDSLDELRSRLNLSEVVGGKVSLKRKSGAEYASVRLTQREDAIFTINDKKGFSTASDVARMAMPWAVRHEDRGKVPVENAVPSST